MTIIMNFMVIESFEQWTSMNPLLLEFILMFIPLVFFSIILNKLTGPELSLIAAISTTIIFGSAFVCLLQVDDPWDFSPLTLMRPLTSSLEHSAFIFTIAYLMMDLPWCIFGYPNETSWTRIQYCCHHVLCAVTLVAQVCIYTDIRSRHQREPRIGLLCMSSLYSRMYGYE